jgi:hypothetical protein
MVCFSRRLQRTVTVVAAVGFTLVHRASADRFVTYLSGGLSGNASKVLPGVVVSNLTLHGDFVFDSTYGTRLRTERTGTGVNDDHLEFTISAAPGKILTFDTLALDHLAYKPNAGSPQLLSSVSVYFTLEGYEDEPLGSPLGTSLYSVSVAASPPPTGFSIRPSTAMPIRER